ncbi:MAG TPA: P-II family nitrogen regulator [Lachnospiraceae bacterium]|nr:P-II family nitrogen regulator [Lachnospiraceae bacterium]
MKHSGFPKAGEKVVPVAEAVPVKVVPNTEVTNASGFKLTKIDIITKPAKFEDLKMALNEIGVTGLTVTHTLGCGMQKGKTEFYRGVETEVNVLPKIQVEVVVAKVPVRQVVNTVKDVLYSGHIGDGKIFVYNVENVIKVRTGEEGYDALQDGEVD